MGDISGEPSMEEILSSIKRIIAEEGDTPTRRRPGRGGATTAAPTPPRFDDHGPEEEVLELSDPMPHAEPERAQPDPAIDTSPVARPELVMPEAMRPEPARPEPVQAEPARPEPARSEPVRPEPVRAETPEPAPRQPILSGATAEASRGALAALSKLLVKPEAESDGTLEGLVREMLRPMLREWLDANLPSMVETMVAREIAKINGQSV